MNEAVEGFAVATPNVWAQWTPMQGSEFFSGDAKQAEQSGTFRIRYRTDVDARWQVLWENRLYELTAPPEEVNYKYLLDLQVKLSTDQSPDAIAPTSQVFTVDLVTDDDLKAIVFPTAFLKNPNGLFVQLVIPTGGYTITADPVWDSLAPTGFNVQLGATITADMVGYKLSIIAVK